MKHTVLVGLFVLATARTACAAAIFQDDFEDADSSGWNTSGDVSITSLHAIGQYSLRIKQTGNATLTVSTADYSGVSITMHLAATSLENGDDCYAEFSTDGGASWTTLVLVQNGNDYGTFFQATASPAAADDNPDLVLRFRSTGANAGDYCYGDNVAVDGTAGDLTPEPDPDPGTEPGGTVGDFDPLTGSGDVNRANLTFTSLTGGSDPGSRVDVSAWGVPPDAAQPVNSFEGKLVLNGESTGGSFDEIKDTFRYTGNGDTTRKHLPEFDFDFVQTGTHLVPAQRGSIPSSHPEWEYVLEPGRVWQENGDNGYSRAAIPFSLHQRNANCMHNGLMTFLFKDDGSVSQVAYQVSSETCLYFQFDMWGLLGASYTPAPVAGAPGLIADHQNEVNGRLPVKPIADLAVDYPGSDPNEFGSPAETDPAHMTLFGFVIDGTHYVGGCDTRWGTHPYCDSVTLPSYSTAKSLFAAVALMRLEKKHPGFVNHVVADHVPDCATNGNWSDVTYGNVIDMGTGNYNLTSYMGDEGATHTNDLFLPEDHASKIAYSCTEYPRKSAPGMQWVYHTSDTYILGTAMNHDLRQAEGSGKDIFEDTLLDELWRPLGISKTAQVTRRTYDAAAQPFSGWGLTLLRDDIAKLTTFLNVDQGAIGGVPMLDAALLDAALQRNPSDRGLDPLPDFKYNNGYWAHEVSSSVGCPADVWVPFMSGFGGITVLLLPNGTTYYYFSDDDTYLWMDAAIESHRIRSLCS